MSELTSENLVNGIKEYYLGARAAIADPNNASPKNAAFNMRGALESSVKLYYLKAYFEIPPAGQGWLNKAINDPRFSSRFSKFAINDMQTLRKTCNAVVHGESTLSLAELNELADRLDLCLKAVVDAIKKLVPPS